MPDFSNGVATPGGASYMAPLLNFSAFGDLANDYYQGQFNRQQQQLNQQRIAQGQRQTQLAQAFPNGLPTDPRTGAINYGSVAATLAKFGDVGDAINVMQQQPPPLSPMFGGPGGQGGQPTSATSPASTDATAAKIIQAESGGNPDAKNPNSSAAGLGGFTDSTWVESIRKYFPNLAQGRNDDQLLAMRRIPQLASRVTQAFTADHEAGLAKAGLPVTPATTYLAHFAGLGGAIKVLNADPNTPVSQLLGNAAIKANPFLKGMTASDLQAWAARKMQGPAMVAQNAQAPQGGRDATSAGVRVADAGSSPVSFPSASFADRFAAAVPGGGSNLPPSANAGTPAPQIAAPQAAPAAQPQPQPVQPQAQPQQPQPQQPLVPQVPLPKGFTDPQQAIQALRNEAIKYYADPRRGAAQQAQALDAWASRIEQSIKPIAMHAGETLFDPRTRQPIYSAPSNVGGQVGQLVRLENSERTARGEPPMTAQEEISFIQGVRPPRSAPAMAVESFKRDFQQQNGRPPSAEEITKFASDYSRQQSYGRAAGSQGARVENAANEVVQLLPQAIEASRAYERQGGKFVALNKLFQSYDQGTSDPKYNDFVLANFSLVNAYTRAMNPQGVPRIQERLEQHAMGILSTATSQKAYEVQARRLWKEVQASKTATAETAKGVTPGDINAPVPGLDSPLGRSSPNVTPDGVNWNIVQ